MIIEKKKKKNSYGDLKKEKRKEKLWGCMGLWMLINRFFLFDEYFKWE